MGGSGLVESCGDGKLSLGISAKIVTVCMVSIAAKVLSETSLPAVHCHCLNLHTQHAFNFFQTSLN